MVDFDREALVSTEWLASNLASPDLRIVDASYYLPHEGLDARAEFALHHIPRAVFFDIDEISESDTELPHMLPSPQKFSSRVRKLGLGDGLRMVVYDQRGLFSAARVWWTFRTFGHREVAVLDGGLPKWMDEGRPLEDGNARPDERHFTARVNTLAVRDKAQMLTNLDSRRDQVLDVRSRGRFEGSEPELWPGRRPGHIPGSLNLPYAELVDPDSKTMLPVDALREKLRGAGIDYGRGVVTTCGSGVTAAIGALALHRTGHKNVAVYDGSWAEWGLADDTPVETGAAEVK